MNETTLLNTCPKCGADLPSTATSGLCPRCLMAEAMLPTKLDPALSSFGEIVTPSELAPHFPQLEILECLGRGGMGVVYKARQKTLNRLVALKLLAPERAHDTAFAERFVREAQALAALNHPSIVTIYDFGQAGGFFFLLMEFVDGVNLRQAMQAGRFTPEQALAIVPPVCEALQYAHEHRILHRDIKPENLLLDKGGRVKIADFGIAKIIGRDADTPVRSEGRQTEVAASLSAGTPQYMAPEQKEHRVTDHRADIYSLGVVLYEMLTGERPKEDLVPPSKRVQVDVRIDEIVLRALEKTPELRFATAAEFRTQVENLATPAGVESRSLKPWERSWLAWPEGKRAFLQGALFLLILALTLGFGWIDREVVVSAPNPQTGVFQNEVRIHVGAGQPWLVEIERWTQDGRQSWPEFSSGTPSFFCGPAALAVWILLVRLVRVTQGPALIRLRTAPDTAGRSHVLWPNVFAAWLGAVAVVSLGVLLLIAAMAALGGGAPPAIPSLLLSVVPVSMLVFVGLRLPPAAKGVVGPPAASVGNSSPPRFSRAAIWGACWAPLFFVAFVLFSAAVQVSPGEHQGSAWWLKTVILAVGVLGFAAPFGTTILGWIAVSQVRRSAGRIYGLGLAVFDGLLFPLLLLDGFFAWVVIRLLRIFVEFHSNLSNLNSPQVQPPFITRLANLLSQNHELVLLIAVLGAIVLDFLIIRRVWRAVKQPTENSTAAVAAGSRSGCLRVIAILGVAVFAIFAVMLSVYFLARAPSPASASFAFPKIAHISGNHRSVEVVHDDAALHYVFYYPGDFSSSSSGSQNTHSLTWMDEGSIKLGNGRTFGYHRESTDPEHVRVNGAEYELRQGRVLVLGESGAVEQLKLFPPFTTARDPEELAKLIAAARWMNEEPITVEKLRLRLAAAEAQMRDLLRCHEPTHSSVIEARESIEALTRMIGERTGPTGHGQLEKTLTEVIELQAALAARRLEMAETHPAVMELQKKLNGLAQKAENLRALIRQSAPKQ